MLEIKENKKRASNSVLIYLLSGGIVASFIFIGSSLVFKNFNSFRYSVVEKEIANQEIEKPVHLSTPDSVRGIYMTSWVASTRDWRSSLVKMVEETELNSIVIDVKDYTGKIAFEVSDPELQKIGSSEKRINDARDFVKSLHEKNIYVIARIAVFQDPYMVKIRPDLAVKTKSGAVWKDKKGLTWVDPCAKEYWDYTVRIAKEAERVGFDELNFDYIRFASDGDMRNIIYPFCDPKIPKADIIEEFFKYLSENLKDVGVPLSADLFGMVTTNTDDLNIGQVLEKAEPYFDLGATYTAEMVRKEKQAVYDAGLSSWLLWDPSNKYTREALDKN